MLPHICNAAGDAGTVDQVVSDTTFVIRIDLGKGDELVNLMVLKSCFQLLIAVTLGCRIRVFLTLEFIEDAEMQATRRFSA